MHVEGPQGMSAEGESGGSRPSPGSPSPLVRGGWGWTTQLLGEQLSLIVLFVYRTLTYQHMITA